MNIHHIDEPYPEREGDDLVRQFLALLDDSETEEERIEKVRELIRGVTLGVKRALESPGEA